MKGGEFVKFIFIDNPISVGFINIYDIHLTKNVAFILYEFMNDMELVLFITGGNLKHAHS